MTCRQRRFVYLGIMFNADIVFPVMYHSTFYVLSCNWFLQGKEEQDEHMACSTLELKEFKIMMQLQMLESEKPEVRNKLSQSSIISGRRNS